MAYLQNADLLLGAALALVVAGGHAWLWWWGLKLMREPVRFRKG